MTHDLARNLLPRGFNDLRVLGDTAARILLRVITQRIQDGEPDKSGKPLAGRLVGRRRIRTGSTRIVYRVKADAIEVLIVAVGQRRDSEVYAVAEKRL